MKHLLFQVAILSVLHKFNIFKFRGKKPAQEIIFQDNEPCPNCGTVLENRYCSNCGQDRLAGLPRTFKQMASAFFSIIFYDKAWKTLLKLLFRPGFLSVEYLERRLTPYTQPFKMFWVMLLSFTIIFSLDETTKFELVKKSDKDKQEQQTKLIENKTDDINDDIIVLYEDVADEAVVFSENISDKENIFSKDITDEAVITSEDTTDEENILPEKEADDNSSLNVLDYFPYFMLLLIPIIAAFLKLLFRKEKYAFSLHLVFTVHLHTFFFFLLILQKSLKLTLDFSFSESLLIDIINIVTLLLTFSVTGIYSILSAIKFYNNRKKRGVVWRMLLIGFLYFISFFVVIILILIITQLFWDYDQFRFNI